MVTHKGGCQQVKKLSFPNSFHSLTFGLTRCRRESVLQAVSEPDISSLDSGRLSAVFCSRRGDPFSHPSGSSAWRQVRAIHPPLNRKGGPAATPLRLVSCAPSAYPLRPGSASASEDIFFRCMICFHLPAWCPSGFCGTRKRSVPGRVHSVGKSFGFAGSCCQAPASNPLWTHGTVESPIKYLLAAVFR